MIVEDVFETIIYPNMKTYVENNSIYSPHITKTMPQESKVFPIVPTKLLPVTNEYNNLSYSEETYKFGIEIDIYSQDISNEDNQISKRTVCNEITHHIVDYFKKNYRVTIQVELDVVNVDSTVHRNNIKITGKLDTRYKDRLVIYPN